MQLDLVGGGQDLSAALQLLSKAETAGQTLCGGGSATPRRPRHTPSISALRTPPPPLTPGLNNGFSPTRPTCCADEGVAVCALQCTRSSDKAVHCSEDEG